ncbi:MAG: hypothetical protein HY680_10140 [Chloroflexi bacterium]|nr:hypothetical protein [Chloroflexota bacterium]
MSKLDEYTMPEGQWRRLSRRWSLQDQGPSTICYASLCRYALACPSKTAHPKRMPQHKCPRYWPEVQRPAAGLSIYVRGLLKRYRGQEVASAAGDSARARE